MKIVLSIFLILILNTSCKNTSLIKYKSPSQKEIKKVKEEYTNHKISKISFNANLKKPKYIDNILLALIKKYKKINQYLYGTNIKHIKTDIIYINNPYLVSAEALPNSNIGISRGFIDLIHEKGFNDNDMYAFLCHESAHILHDDWGSAIKKSLTQTAFPIKIEKNALTRLLLNSLINIPLNHISAKNISYNIDLESNTLDFSKKDIFSKDYINHNVNIINFLDSQGFTLETELHADRETLICLDGIGKDKLSLVSLLLKIKKLPSSDKNRLNKRIRKLKEQIDESF